MAEFPLLGTYFLILKSNRRGVRTQSLTLIQVLDEWMKTNCHQVSLISHDTFDNFVWTCYQSRLGRLIIHVVFDTNEWVGVSAMSAPFNVRGGPIRSQSQEMKRISDRLQIIVQWGSRDDGWRRTYR